MPAGFAAGGRAPAYAYAYAYAFGVSRRLTLFMQ